MLQSWIRYFLGRLIYNFEGNAYNLCERSLSHSNHIYLLKSHAGIGCEHLQTSFVMPEILSDPSDFHSVWQSNFEYIIRNYAVKQAVDCPRNVPFGDRPWQEFASGSCTELFNRRKSRPAPPPILIAAYLYSLKPACIIT